jgi:ElaB/YqjD/DUF883 family membrane-anchored ribosome-binding protein
MEPTSEGIDPTANYSTRTLEREPRSQADELELREAWGDATNAVERLYVHASSVVQEQVQQRPYAALAAAAGLGFVLGGGLGSSTGRLLLRTTAQLLIPAALTKLRGFEE